MTYPNRACLQEHLGQRQVLTMQAQLTTHLQEVSAQDASSADLLWSRSRSH